jgi:hypothetical protein
MAPAKKASLKGKHPSKEEPRLKILVSSAVLGYEDLLESIYALLDSYRYDVVMSHKGTLPVNPEISAMDSCLESVRECHVFLGLILPSYGHGKEEADGLSITHREAIEAIKLNKPRWFLVHEHVAIARELLKPYRDKSRKDGFHLMPGITFGETPILSDPRVIDLYELAMRHDISEVKHRKGNWVQPYGPEDDARLFVNAQFRRYRELADKYLPKLKDTAAIRSKVKGGKP